MSSPIDNGVVVVTGASSGIGAALCRQLARRARVLVLVARRTERLQALADELKGQGARCEVRAADLGSADSARALLSSIEAEFGAVDVLINNAGMGDIGLFETSDPTKVEQMIAVNVVGLTAATRAVLPGMVKRGRGGILNVSSGFGLLFQPGFAAYVGTKHYVTGFTDSLRTELAGTGVRVTQVCPGPVATEFEAVAGNATGMKVPALLELSPAACASATIAAFDRDRALSVPGAAAWVLIHSGWWTPRVVLRWVSSLGGRMLRKRLQGNAP